MENNNFLNCEPLILTNGDFGHKFIVQISDTDDGPLNFMPYPNMTMVGHLSERCDDHTVVASCVCTPLDKEVGQFYFSFPKGALDWNQNTEVGVYPGYYELSFIIDYYGDGSQEVSTAYNIVKVKILGRR